MSTVSMLWPMVIAGMLPMTVLPLKVIVQTYPSPTVLEFRTTVSIPAPIPGNASSSCCNEFGPDVLPGYIFPVVA